MSPRGSLQLLYTKRKLKKNTREECEDARKRKMPSVERRGDIAKVEDETQTVATPWPARRDSQAVCLRERRAGQLRIENKCSAWAVLCTAYGAAQKVKQGPPHTLVALGVGGYRRHLLRVPGCAVCHVTDPSRRSRLDERARPNKQRAGPYCELGSQALCAESFMGVAVCAIRSGLFLWQRG